MTAYERAADQAIRRCVPASLARFLPFLRFEYDRVPVQDAAGTLWLVVAVGSPLGKLRSRVAVGGPGAGRVELLPA